jgi:hypothetical protein
METHDFTQSLGELVTGKYEWTFGLYSAKKSRDGITLDIGKTPMKDIATLADAIRCALLEKTLQERTVTDYSPLLQNEYIGALSGDSELLGEPLCNMLDALKTADTRYAEDYYGGLYSAPCGYAFLGKGPGGETVLFLRRSSPFIKGGKSRICVVNGETVVTSDSPVLKFSPQVDFVFIGGIGYFVTSAAEKDFGFESRHIKIAEKRLKVLGEKGILSNFENFENVAYKNKHARKFMNFSTEVAEHIERMSAESRADFLSSFGIDTDGAGLLQTDDEESCELIIDLLCGRSCLDALGRLSVANNIQPRE